MRICLLDHHTKAAYLGAALGEQGFELVPLDEDFSFDVLLVDTDHPLAAPQPYKHAVLLESLRRGVQVGLYPHGGLPMLDYDMGRIALPVAFELVHGEGHKVCYEAAGLKRRIEVVGWSYCDTLPRSTVSPHHVIFAPIHPWADGKTILPMHRALNEVAYQTFLQFPAEKKTVRLFGEDPPNGVTERVDTVVYTSSDLGLGIDLIDTADAVVSYGTFACTALARGKPTAMIYPYPPHMNDEGTIQATHFASYAESTRYPASVSDGPLAELFQMDTSDWEQRFIGGPLDQNHLADVIRSYRLNRKQRRIKARH